jgi:3-hydroxyisobutyrate dehydrogenase-like beta-hydroxyacid dehydrogenase
MSDPKAQSIGLVGYGEVGKILAAALVERGVAWVGTWDILLPDPATGPAMRAHAEAARVVPASSLADLLARADVVLSAVTASQAVAVAREAGYGPARGSSTSTRPRPAPSARWAR